MKKRFIVVCAALSLAAAHGAAAGAADAIPLVPSWLGKGSQAKIWDALPSEPSAVPKAKRRVLVFSKGAHSGVWAGMYAFQALGVKSGAYEPVPSDDPASLLPESLAGFDAVVFNNSGIPWDEKIRDSILDFLERGGGVAGTHSAILAEGPDMAYRWMWGAGYSGYAWHEEIGVKRVPLGVKSGEPAHPLLAAFQQQTVKLRDEIYQFCDPYSRGHLRVLLAVDTDASGAPFGEKDESLVRADNDFALAWIRRAGNGRLFYCALGHEDDVFFMPDFMRFYLDAMQFVLGDHDVPAAPSAWGETAAGALDPDAAWARVEKSLPAAESVVRQRCPTAFLDSDLTREKIVFLKALATYFPDAARQRLKDALLDESPQMRAAAIEGLAASGDLECLPAMAEAVCSAAPAEKKIARSAMARMRGDNVERAMLDLARDTGRPPCARGEAISVLVERRAAGAAPVFIETARDPAHEVSKASLAALRELAGGDSVPALIGLVKDARTPDECAAAAGALACAANRAGATEKEVGIIVSALSEAKPDARAGLLAALGGIGGETAMAAIAERAGSDPDDAVRAAAVRSLAAWPDPAPCEKLLALAREEAVADIRAAALGGYIRILGMKARAGAVSPADAVGMYEAAMEMADRAEEEILALNGLAKVKDLKALVFLEKYLEETAMMGDDDLLPHAERAYLDAAIALSQTHPGESKAALSQFSVSSQNSELVEKAKKILEWLK